MMTRMRIWMSNGERDIEESLVVKERSCAYRLGKLWVKGRYPSVRLIELYISTTSNTMTEHHIP